MMHTCMLPRPSRVDGRLRPHRLGGIRARATTTSPAGD